MLIPIVEEIFTAVGMLAQPNQHSGRGSKNGANDPELLCFLAVVSLCDAQVVAPQPTRLAGS